MIKHTRKIILALLVASVLAMTGSAWGSPYPGGATMDINANYPSRTSNTIPDTNTTNPIAPAPQLDLSHPSALPVGWVTGGPWTINSTVDLNTAGGGTAYNIANFDTVITNLSGATNLNGQTLNLSPTTYHWVQWNGIIFPGNTNTNVWIREHIGVAGDVLRLYDTDGGGYMKITAKNLNTDGAGNGDLLYTGGTYLDSGTLEFAIDTSFTPANGANNAGNITLGSLYAQWPAILKLYPPTSFIPILKIDDAIATLDTTGAQAANVATINRLWLTSNATDWSIDPGVGRTIQMHPTAGTYQVDTNETTGSTFHVLSGTFDFHLVGTDVRTNLQFESNPANTPSVIRTAATGSQAFGNVTVKPGAGNYGRLSVETTNLGQPGGIFDIRAVIGNPVIDIIDPYETVAIPANSNLWDVWGVGTLRAKPGMPPIQLMAAVPGSASPNTWAAAAAPKTTPAVFAPRLDIMDGAVVNDLYTGTSRTYSGLNSGPNGTGTLTMPGTPNATLNLVPIALGYTNNFRNTLPSAISALVLNADAGIPATDSAFTQTLSGTNSPAGAMLYRIDRGILEFAKPDSIRNNTTGPVTVNINAATPSALKLDYNASGYDFTGNGGRPNGTLDLTNPNARIIMTPAANNTTTVLGSLGSTPAVFQLATVNYTHPNVLNFELDGSRLPTTTGSDTGYVKLLSDFNAIPFSAATDTNFPITLNPASGVTLTDNHALISATGNYLYIGYKKPAGSGGGGGSVTYDVTIDMTTIKSADLSGGKLTVIAVSGDKASTYDLSNTKVKIVVDENDPASITNKGNVFNITYKYPTILNGVPITVSFKDSTGTKTSFTTTAKIVNGVSVLEFPATGLPSGTYEITLSSPSGRNPFYEGKVALAYDYTAPRGLVFTMTATKTSDQKGIAAYATVTSADIPQTGVKVVFTLEDSDGKAVGSTYTQTTGADGKTGTVTFPNLANGTYTVRAAATGFNVETENVITITANSNPTPPNPTPTPSSGSSSGGCDAGFGAFALLAMTGGALVLRRKD